MSRAIDLRGVSVRTPGGLYGTATRPIREESTVWWVDLGDVPDQRWGVDDLTVMVSYCASEYTSTDGKPHVCKLKTSHKHPCKCGSNYWNKDDPAPDVNRAGKARALKKRESKRLVVENRRLQEAELIAEIVLDLVMERLESLYGL